ncbi:mucin-17 [Drosophila navojoa]|uniref:mucin-17 n=1 Tax=Drosophila navojoa TaxID=7232 RepID=UPI0008479DBD|nr:mucin-17 [Drosophila navojoa]
MDEAKKQFLKSPTTMPTSGQGQAENNKIPMPSSTPSSAQSLDKGGSLPRRIINQIPLDFKKLKDAGLHRKLAEALSKQNVLGTKSIASETTKVSPSKSAILPTAAPTNATTPAAHTQTSIQEKQHHEEQNAASHIANNKLISRIEQSSHIKRLIKNKILNKSAKSEPQQQQKREQCQPPAATPRTAPTSSGTISRSGQSSGFSVPIAKADLTVRSHPPLLLNLVNQLPRHRAMCGGISQNRQSSPARAPEIDTSINRVSSPAISEVRTVSTSTTSKSPPPLIVLENKVLTPEEKIDLRALRLPNGKSTAVPTTSASTVADSEHADKEKTAVKKPSAPIKKIILNVNKLKLPRERISQLAKEVHKQAMQHVQQQKLPSIDNQAVKPVQGSVASNIETVPPTKETCASSNAPVTTTSTSTKPSSSAMPSSLIDPVIKTIPTPMISLSSSAPLITSVTSKKPSSSLIIASSVITPKCIKLDLSSEVAASSKIPASTNIESASLITPSIDTSTSPITLSSPDKATKGATNKTIIEISSPSSTSERLSSPLPSSAPPSSLSTSPEVNESPSHELSAVDFIAQLTATDDGDSNNYFELSPEEMSLNAKFGNCQSSIPPPPAQNTKPEDDLAIGKILQLQDMDILHATLNVNGKEPNVLSISPNATIVESSASTTDTETPANDSNNEEQSDIVKLKPMKVPSQEPVYTNPKKNYALSKPPAVVEPESSVDETPKSKMISVSETKVELHGVEEKKQIAKPIPYKPKKGKINLVQRNKKPTVSKPNESIGKNLADEQLGTSNMVISSDSTELKDAQSAQNLMSESLEDVTDSKLQSKNDLNQNVSNINPAEVENKSEQPKITIAEKEIATDNGVKNSIENLTSTSGDKTEISNKTERVIAEDGEDVNKVDTEPIQEKDLSQLYHPPKMSKLKSVKSNKKDNHNGTVHEAANSASTQPSAVSLFDAVKQKQPPPQEALGIQNLVTHLAAEKVVTCSNEVKPESTAKLPRKKLLKTRPVLTVKRPAKAAQAKAAASEKAESLNAMKRPLHVESNSNGANRTKTSSTSDDDGDFFHGFEEKSSSKRVKHSKARETDISDDASPDYDETEEELLTNKPKTESVINNSVTNESIDQEADAETNCQQDVVPTEPVMKESLKRKASKRNSRAQDAGLETEPKRARRSVKGKDAKSSSGSTVNVKSPKSKDVNPSTEAMEIENIMEINAPDEAVTNEPAPVTRRRGRPPKSCSLSTPKAKIQSEDINSTPTPKRRGRKPKEMEVNDSPESCKKVNDYYMRLLLIRNRSQLESDEELREDGRGEGDKQCGLCLVRCNSATWQSHIAEHYGVGWSIEEPPPLLTRNNVAKMIKTYMDGGKKGLSCRLCKVQLYSAMGLLIHLEGCGTKQRIVCEHCNGSYTKLSFATHSRTCSKRVAVQSEEEPAAEAAPEEDNLPVYSNTGRAKRKSTLKAETKLEKIASQTENIKETDGDASDYEITADKESSDDEDDESEVSSISDEPAKILPKRENALRGRINVKKEMKERSNYFIQNNYAKDTLYPHLLPRYEKLSPADAEELLPSMESTSMRYAYGGEHENDWMHLRPQEGFQREDESVCYLGTPIKELAWVPLPSHVKTQYLLCSQRNKVLGYSRQHRDKPEKALLFLLECKMSPGCDDNVFPLQIRVHYGICVPEGPVHSIAFMPSGGYDESINRLGLLAVGSALGTIIYALPLCLKHERGHTNKQTDVIVLQPVLTLSLDIDNPVQDACTKICWSESSGHGLIVSGYVSGNVAFYDISDDQGLNYMERNDQRYCVPAHFFYFGEKNIFLLELHYDSNGVRWLVVGTTVRKLWVYDIANLSQPLPITGDTVCNMYLGGLAWSPLWETLVVGCSEVYKAQFPRLLTLNPSGMHFSHATFDITLSSARSVHFNWEHLTLVVGTDNGDVDILFCDHLNLPQRRSRDCRVVSTMDVRRLNDSAELNSVTPEEFKQDYGLILKPLRRVAQKQKKSTYLNIKRLPNFDLLNLMRLNSVRWNWNAEARNWVAVGAEHGLLRIINYDADKKYKYF